MVAITTVLHVILFFLPVYLSITLRDKKKLLLLILVMSGVYASWVYFGTCIIKYIEEYELGRSVHPTVSPMVIYLNQAGIPIEIWEAFIAMYPTIVIGVCIFKLQ